ncbi:acyl-CoA thioesterase [Campylobacter sp. RM9344]|uniref:Acyl-CoA thioesterase n=1 Tax=Campylobacter californiensis TaxID=1032243 RepID=A0AAW3ZUN8_9BACT|nr:MULTISPECIES: thioesterase family protein [unclassified Campylobacter]MBE2984552.1 acyl-CoA thioesterase [Campylobacter sp. RM6883]MBE2987019.1 acyl-CoA thioesterase [Campylobacter sp. RM12919]MBE2988694.1 acyl-CoA thioesterase [Campylobacter sp. RM12920]MBE2995160.1 acyl-CoA thioesterase [Campylobacter sp. RM6913]MBE3021699.1 acyl-CoA thioesterase [Campylobacter sp. 7477a]MBE3029081.1 acyl-CoA thioesterase [Campylobacter sp. RM9344]
MKEFIYKTTVPPQAIDMHGHMNNTYYFILMQEAAFAHSNTVGDTIEAQKERNGVWLITTNEASYIAPVKLGDKIEIYTWTQALKRASSVRFFEFKKDGEIFATAKTCFVYFDPQKSRPKAIPQEILKLYE